MAKFKPVPPSDPNAPQPPLVKRLLWMGILMGAGALVVAGAAYILRGLLFIE